MKKLFNNPNILKYLLLTLVIVEICLLSFYNVISNFSFDQDAAKVMYHAIKMWESKSFVLPNWSYMTTGEWDCSAFLAIPIYGLTNNIFLSFSISNIINIIIFAIIIYILLSSVSINKKYIYIALAIIFIPYKWDMLGYTNMLFYSASQYIYKVLTGISLLALLHYHDRYKNKVVYYSLFILILLLIFLTVTSSGLYVPACSLFAIYFTRLVYYLINKSKVNKNNLIVLVRCLLMILVSYYLHLKWRVYSSADNIIYGNFIKNIGIYFKSLIDVFGIELNNPLLSPHGVVFILKIILFIFIICFGLMSFGYTFCISNIFNKDIKNDNYLLKAELISIFVTNSLITILTTPTSRYELIGVIPLVLLSVINFSEYKFDYRIDYLVFICLFILNVITQYSSYIFITYEYRYNYDEKTCKEILDEAYKNNIDMIVFCDSTEWAEVLRLYDMNIDIRSYDSISDSFKDYDVYDGFKDSSYMEDKNCIVLINGEDNTNDLSDYIKDNYIYSHNIDDFLVYMKESSLS